MAAFLKSKLKAAREAITKKDYNAAQEAANQVLEYDSKNYSANVFLGLACLELGDRTNSEQAYNKAIDISPEQPLAWQGISKFYEQSERWQDFGKALLRLMDIFATQKEPMKCAETLQKYIDLQRTHGTREQVIESLSLLLPGSTLYHTLEGLPDLEPTAPTTAIAYAVQVAVQNCLPTLEEIVSLTERNEEEKIKKEVDRRRMRLGANRPEIIKNEVGREVWESSRLPLLYNEILNHQNASDELRRTTESKLLRRIHLHLKSVPNSAHDSKKNQLLSEVQTLSSGMVLLGIPDELAWTISLESKEGYDHPTLRRFCEVFPSSSLTSLIRGYFKYNNIPISLDAEEEEQEDSDFANAYNSTTEDDPLSIALDAFEHLPDSLLAHRMISELYTRESDHGNMIKMAERGMELVDRFEEDYGIPFPRKVFLPFPVRKEFKVTIAVGLVHLFPPKNHTRALKILDDVLNEDPDNVPCLMGRGYVFQYRAQWSTAENQFLRVDELQSDPDTKLEAREQSAWCKVKLGDLEAGASELRLLIKVLETEPGKELQKARAWWRLGCSLWESGHEGPEEAYKHFITSLKRSSSFAPAFTSLGIYYAEVASPPDPDRSSKCFQKAFELDARETEAARRLAEGFAEEREWDLVEVVARRTIEGEGGLEGGDSSKEKGANSRYLPTNAWAWKALGAVELNRHNYSSSIQAFQVALRADQDDFLSWQRLGESYAKSGRHAASVKALQKALDLKPDDEMSLYLMGDIHRLTGQFQNAIDIFVDVLKTHPEDICVLLALAETHLFQGRSQYSEGFLARAQESFTAALVVTLHIFEKHSGFRRIAWKTAADTVYELSRFDVFLDSASVKSSLTSLSSLITFVDNNNSIENIINIPLAVDDCACTDGFYAAQLAVAAHSYRISLGTFDDAAASSTWFDLGVALNRFSNLSNEDAKSTMALRQAEICFQKALDMDPGNCDYWNALGNHNFVQKPRTSQHAYIKALECDSKSTMSWTNLGLLYLYHGDVELANEALLRAQTLDPDCVLAWAGQGLVATANEHHIESTALFEHAIGLSSSVPAADLEFSKRTFITLANPRVRCVPEMLLPPFHALDRYCKQKPNDAAALHLFGLVCERLHHLDLAVDLLTKSIAILERSYEEKEDTLTEQRFAIANGNLGRLRLATGDYYGAIEAFNSTLSLLTAEDDDRQTKTHRAHAQFGLGLAQFKVGEVGDALEMFEAALEELPSEMVDIRGHVTILLSQALWALGSDEARKSARGQLLECIYADPENLTAMTSLVAIGTLECDDTLVDAALSEIRALTPDKCVELDPEHIVEKLLIRHHLSQGHEREALADAQRALHERPLDNATRRALASLLIQRGHASAASAIVANDRLALDQDTADETMRTAAIAMTAHEIGYSRALRLAQKAVAAAPWTKDNWKVLAYVRSAAGVDAVQTDKKQ